MLCDENSVLLADIIENGSEIPIGTKLKLPDDWVNNSSYGIVQETV